MHARLDGPKKMRGIACAHENREPLLASTRAGNGLKIINACQPGVGCNNVLAE
jgi:hypothetical protein